MSVRFASDIQAHANIQEVTYDGRTYEVVVFLQRPFTHSEIFSIRTEIRSILSKNNASSRPLKQPRIIAAEISTKLQKRFLPDFSKVVTHLVP